MKVTIEASLITFSVPDFVFVARPLGPRQEGCLERPKYALSELDADILAKLCEEFTSDVFKKAKKQRPPIAIN